MLGVVALDADVSKLVGGAAAGALQVGHECLGAEVAHSMGKRPCHYKGQYRALYKRLRCRRAARVVIMPAR